MPISMRDAILQRKRNESKKENARKYMLGVIISIGGSVHVANRPGYVWVRELGNNGSSYHCLNMTVAAIEGLPVIMGWSANAEFGWEILGKSPAVARDPNYTGTSFPRAHSESHQMPKGNYGSDPTIVYSPALSPLRVTPSFNFVVNVDPLECYYVDGYPRVFNGGTIDISGKKPAVGYHRWTLVSLNMTTNMLEATIGASVLISAPAPKPEVIQGYLPAGYVLVRGSATQIEVADIDEARGFVHELVNVRHNPYAVAYPTTAADASMGYGVDSIWFYKNVGYLNTNPTVGAATWTPHILPNQDLPIYRTIPGVRGIWLFGPAGSNGNFVDETGQGLLLSNLGTGTYNRLKDSFGNETFVTYFDFNGSTDYGTRPDEMSLDITGAEAYVGVDQGLSMGFWVNFDNTGAARNMGGKLGIAGVRSWYVQRTSGNVIQFGISGDGTALTTVTSSVSLTSGVWYYVGVTFVPSTRMSTYVTTYSLVGRPLTVTTNTTAIPAAIFNSTASFRIGGIQTAVNWYDGKMSRVFLAASGLPEDYHNLIYRASRPGFGV